MATNDSRREYLLATGEAAAARLRLLDEIFGPATRELLNNIGLAEGWNVAEVGCGSGLVSLWMAERVGESGSVAALDQSAEQLQVAKKEAERRAITNVSFHTGDAYQTGLPREVFNLVYSRFVMCHLVDPVRALKEMRSLLRKGGLLVCEDYDHASVASFPSTRAYRRLLEISKAVDASRGLDSTVGSRLHRLFYEAGLTHPEVNVKTAVALRGEKKRFWALTLREAAPAIFAANAAAPQELESICEEIEQIAEDETILVVLASVSQIWARKD
jgi:ubiquinone/menaquinone biosynthesis C-methylase UbiE